MITIGERILKTGEGKRDDTEGAFRGDWKGKKLNPSSDKIAIICEVLDVDPLYLLSGVGQKKYGSEELIYIRKGSEEYELITQYNKLEPAFRQRLLAYSYALLDLQNQP